mmetsp:Transcript_79307/g.131234  ORF Transcript_79307/g.131234 Transcript_79307/m.131234 type:complete len:93 (-) Transcript_79307:172-450(-)
MSCDLVEWIELRFDLERPYPGLSCLENSSLSAFPNVTLRVPEDAPETPVAPVPTCTTEFPGVAKLPVLKLDLDRSKLSLGPKAGVPVLPVVL